MDIHGLGESPDTVCRAHTNKHIYRSILNVWFYSFTVFLHMMNPCIDDLLALSSTSKAGLFYKEPLSNKPQVILKYK